MTNGDIACDEIGDDSPLCDRGREIESELVCVGTVAEDIELGIISICVRQFALTWWSSSLLPALPDLSGGRYRT